MTEKVKLTRDVAEALVTVLEDWSEEMMTHEKVIRLHADDSKRWLRELKPLNKLTLLTLVDALRIGYEVEEEYKVGDWVVDKPSGAVYKVAGLEGRAIITSTGLRIGFSWLRHATSDEIEAEQEREVWAKIGRKPREFRAGDVGTSHEGFSVRTSGGLLAAYENDDLRGFYPAESFIEFGGGEE